MDHPVLPFEGFKWRWACWQCTEGLNEPPIFLGVLRAMQSSEGLSPSDPEFLEKLQEVERETSFIAEVNLARDTTRNLIRNSGQYWKALGLYGNARGEINLTNFGRKTALGEISPAEFATTVVKTLELPNKRIESDDVCEKWDAAGLKLKPLELILEILSNLEERFGKESAFITPEELIRIVIPLSGNKANIEFTPKTRF